MNSTVSRLVRLRQRVLVFAIVVAIGLVVHAGLFFLVSVPIGAGPEEIREEPWIDWTGNAGVGESPVVREQALLLDAEPLFVPTPWNTASALDEIARLRDETELFPPFPPRVGDATGLWSPADPPAVEGLIARRIEAPPLSRPFRLLGVRPEDTAAVSRSPRPALLEVFSLATGAPAAEPRSFAALDTAPPDTLWNPLEFLVLVDAATGGGLPLRLNSSGSPEWDRAVSRALRGDPLLSELPQGYFRILVGP